MPEVTSAPGGNDGPKFDLGCDFPPPNRGRWMLNENADCVMSLYWIGRPSDLPNALPPQIIKLMEAQRTFTSIRKHQRLRLRYKPEPTKARFRDQAVFFICELAQYGDYMLDYETRGFTWFELSDDPRLEPELSKQLLKATKPSQTRRDA